MKTSQTTYPLEAIRAVALRKQGLDAPIGSNGRPSIDDVCSTIERIGCVQIDTLQMVRRSQYLALWSRLGSYNAEDLDRLLSDERRIFEYWYHAACLIPFSEYRYRLPVMRLYRESKVGWRRKWIEEPENRELVQHVHQHVKDNGAARASDFEHDEARRGSWWQWKPAKVALEHLYNIGDFMVANRINFQRVYDLKERVLPDHVDATEPTIEEMRIRLLNISMRSFGVCQSGQIADYTHMKRTDAKPFVEQLLKEGALVPINAELMDGETQELVVHKDDLPLLEKAADGAIAPNRTTFLSPFDNLFWARDRDMQFWNFRQTLECYKPAPQRIWGYFCLPILHKDRLVGRFDPKLERKNGVLRLKALYLEPGVKPDEELVSGVAAAMRDFMAFHDATELIIEKSAPAAFGKKLMKSL